VFGISLGFCVSQSFKFISDPYVSWMVACFFRLIVFHCWHFCGFGAVLFFPLPLTFCRDSWSSFSSLTVLSAASEKSYHILIKLFLVLLFIFLLFFLLFYILFSLLDILLLFLLIVFLLPPFTNSHNYAFRALISYGYNGQKLLVCNFNAVNSMKQKLNNLPTKPVITHDSEPVNFTPDSSNLVPARDLRRTRLLQSGTNVTNKIPRH
jgi:hypothetical protein